MKVRWSGFNCDVGVFNKLLGVWLKSPSVIPIEQAIGKYGVTKVETNSHLVFCQNYKGLKSVVVINKSKYSKWFRYLSGKWHQQTTRPKSVNIKSLPTWLQSLLAALTL